jgi:hypothetical protein
MNSRKRESHRTHLFVGESVSMKNARSVNDDQPSQRKHWMTRDVQANVATERMPQEIKGPVDTTLDDSCNAARKHERRGGISAQRRAAQAWQIDGENSTPR